MNDAQRRAVIGALQEAYLEIFPASGLEDQLDALPADTTVAVTCSPRKGIEATLELVEQVTRRGIRVIPHVSARQVESEAHLRGILARLRHLDVDTVFVPGGDNPEPVGDFSCAVQLLRIMADMDHGIDRIGVAAHPEHHPIVQDDVLIEHLQAKQMYATYMVTQMCFDPAAIMDWLADVRAVGVSLPVWVGLPGVIERRRLLTTSLRIGVGESVGFLRKQRGLAGRLLASSQYEPDALLEGLAPGIANPANGIAGFHIYSFNQVNSTESWRQDCLRRLETQPQRAEA